MFGVPITFASIMAQTYFLPNEAGEAKRPDMISILGILTFVNTGLFILIYAIGAVGMMGISQMPVDEFVALVQDGVMKYMPEESGIQVEEIARVLHGSGVSLMLIYLVRTIARLAGAIGIWRGRRSGFHLYAGAQIIGLFLPHMILPWNMLGVFGPLMTVAMTALYGSQLKRLG